jgi:hypothetical protein
MTLYLSIYDVIYLHASAYDGTCNGENGLEMELARFPLINAELSTSDSCRSTVEFDWWLPYSY